MTLKSDYVEEKEYLSVETGGEYDYKEMISLLEDIKDNCDKCNYNKLLFDIYNIDFTNLETMERFFLGELISKLFVNPYVKIAVIVNPIFVNNFAKNVASNRCAYIEFFEENSKAIKWLKE